MDNLDSIKIDHIYLLKSIIKIVKQYALSEVK